MCAGNKNCLFTILLCLLLAGCADLRIANEAYLAADYERAYDHWSRLAGMGFPEAHYRLAALLAEGRLGTDRVPEALFHFQKALELDHSRSASGLGRFLLRHAKSPDQIHTAVDWLQQAADRGLVAAQIALADLRIDGAVVQRDVKAAISVLLKLAENNEARALYRLGVIHETGIHVAQDDEAAVRFFSQAYELQYARAGIHLAVLYEQGRGVEMDLARAHKILSDLKDQGDLAATYALAGLIERQDPSVELPAKSFALYRSLASAGYGPGRLRVARLYLHGEGVEQDVPRASRILEKLSAEGYGPATAQLGDLFRDGDHQPQDYGRALDLYQTAVMQLFDRAELRIAYMLRRGWGLTQDLEAARLIYTSYANRGVPEAAYELARILEQQAPVGELPATALAWYQAAAKLDHQAARMRLAALALIGFGVPQDIPLGLELLAKLSDEGYGRATQKLGDLYRDGKILPKDHLRAEACYQLAFEQGALDARLRLGDLYASGDPSVRDFVKAAATYRGPIEAGNIEATYKMARLYERRQRKNTVTPEIVDWYAKAAEAGYPPARIRLADLQMEGLGVPQDIDKALALFHEMAAAGLGAATYRLGRTNEFGRKRIPNYQAALALYERSIKQGYERGELYLAQLYAHKSNQGDDTRRAIGIFERFAEKGKEDENADAAFQLAELYREYQTKLDRDWQQQATRWYRYAIDLGSNDARYALAMMIESIQGSSTTESMQLLGVAAEASHGPAMLQYGRRLFRGQHLARNRTEGLAMVLTSARMQTSRAVRRAIEMMSKLEDPGVIDAAQARSQQIWEDLFAASEDSGLVGEKKAQ